MKIKTVTTRAMRERVQPTWLIYVRISWSLSESGADTCGENTQEFWLAVFLLFHLVCHVNADTRFWIRLFSIYTFCIYPEDQKFELLTDKSNLDSKYDDSVSWLRTCSVNVLKVLLKNWWILLIQTVMNVWRMCYDQSKLYFWIETDIN